MGIIKETVLELAGFLILSSVLEQFIQDMKYKKYYKLAVGMIVIFIMLEPIQSVFAFRYPFTEQYLELEYKNEIEELERSLGSIQEKISEEDLQSYAGYIGTKMTQTLKEENFQIEETTVSVGFNTEGQIDINEVIVYRKKDAAESIETLYTRREEEKFLKQYIAQRYQIRQEVITIK
jgi:stage III sporulation protein AF